MKNLLKSKYLSFVFRLIIGGYFAYASLYKITDPFEFARSVYNYHFLPGSVINLFAIIVPWLELIFGMALILGIFVESAAFVIGVLLVMFIIALTSAAIRGLDIACGCFSSMHSTGENLWKRIIEDLIFLILIVQVYYGYGGFASLEKLVSKQK